MKHLILCAYLMLLATCSSTKKVRSKVDEVKSEQFVSSSIPEGLKAKLPTEKRFTSPKQIAELMNYLASDKLGGRDSGSEGIELAAQFIESHFKKCGILPYYQTYRDTLSNFRKPAYNIVGWIEENDPSLKDEFIVIGGHYDHIGYIKPENDDYIANGANDNASGTTVVMELARYFGQKQSNQRSLIFALFSAEEKGLLGSKHMAKNMKEANLNLYVMLNFEMVGVPLGSKQYELYITGYHKSNLAEISNSYAKENLIGYLPTAKNYGLFQRSDNYSFYDQFKIPSHTFCAFDFTNFDFYHKVGDEVDKMDFNHMAHLVNKMMPVVEGIANAPNQELIIK